MAYYLGVDGGGSKTTCAVGDESTTLAIVTTGPSNVVRVGEAQARDSLHLAVRQGCAAAGITPAQIARACIGAAGAGRPKIAEVIRRAFKEISPAPVYVTTDVDIGFEAAFCDDPGVIVIAGTGSIAYGRNAQGTIARAGGWGFAISDEGSAYWIGRTAVNRLLRAIDQQHDQAKDDQAAAERLPLFHELVAAWNLHSLDEVVRAANSGPDFAALFPAILSIAEAGDAVALRVLAQAGRELAQLVAIVGRRLFAQDNLSLPAIPLAIVGGVFRHSPRVRESFCNEVRILGQGFGVSPEIVDPVNGALQMARKPARGAEV